MYACVYVRVHACIVCVLCFYWECLELTNPTQPLLQGCRIGCCHLAVRGDYILKSRTLPCLGRKMYLFRVQYSHYSVLALFGDSKDSWHFITVSSIWCIDTPCASHLLCKNNPTWHYTTLTEVFLEKTFGNQFASPIIFHIPRQINAPVWHMTKSPPLRGCLFWDALLCIAWLKCWAAERCFLSRCPGVAPAGTCSAFTGCQLRDFMLDWSNLESVQCWLMYWPLKGQESVFCVCDIKLRHWKAL